MSKLQAMYKMQEKVCVYVPSTVNVSESVDTTEYVEHAMFLLSNLFGGATAEKVTGSYVSNDGKLVKEDVTKVYAYGNDVASKIDDVVDFCEYLQIKLKQECIGLEYNNDFYLVNVVKQADKQVG